MRYILCLLQAHRVQIRISGQLTRITLTRVVSSVEYQKYFSALLAFATINIRYNVILRRCVFVYFEKYEISDLKS